MASPTRRGLLKATLVIGGATLVMARPWTAWRAPDLAFEPADGLAPLRRLAARGEASLAGTGAALIGLGTSEEPPEDSRLRARLQEDLCGALSLRWREDEPVPVTYFTDVRCPACRVLEARLAELAEDQTNAFTLTTREYPVFGPHSEASARIIRAGASQNAAEILRAQLQRRPPPMDAAGLTALAERLTLDADALLAAWSAPNTALSLAADRTLARLLRLPGTPGLVVGRTIVIGDHPTATLRHLLQMERDAGPPSACT